MEQRNLLSELINGLKAAKQLGVALSPPPSSSSSSCFTAETKETLLQQIVSSYEKAILMVNGQHNIPRVELAVDPVAKSGIVPESTASVTESPKSEDCNLSSKKRKTLPKWTEQVRISPERGLEGPHDDVFSWRKYGQKDILGSKYPRSYYRCTFRNTQNCWATKQVQRSDRDPTIFEITYKGTHTCSQVIPPTEKRETKSDGIVVNYQNDLLNNLKTNLSMCTDGITATNGFSFPITPPFYSHESIDESATFCHMGSSSPSDFSGLMSTNTSTGSSPIFDVNFHFDPTTEIEAGFSTFLHNSI